MKGSKKLILDFISSSDFVEETNKQIHPYATINTNNTWIHLGVDKPIEGQIYSFFKPINFELAKQAKSWWIKYGLQTPHWDLISTCTINGKQGILLVETKAHWSELEKESKGKPFNEKEATENSKANHKIIKNAINEANTEINKNC